MKMNNFITKYETRDDLSKDSQENLLEGIGIWGAFYRKNPGRFCIDYLKIDIHPFQHFLLYQLINNYQNAVLATRGLGKTWILGLFSVIMCILFPGSIVVVSSKRKSQAKELLGKVMGETMYGKSYALRQEIKRYSDNNNDQIIEFHNGSKILTCVSNEDARSKRATVLICDEYVKMDCNIVDTVLVPFLSTPRQCGFMTNPEYRGKKEYYRENTEVYLSSGWYSSEWGYQRYQECVKGMLENEGMFACSLPFTVALEHGLTSERMIRKEMKKESMSASKFLMEYCALFFHEREGAFYQSKFINPCRTIEDKDVFYPPNKNDYLRYKMLDDKPYQIPKVKGEIRIISCDIAISKGKGKSSKDNSIYDCIRLIPKNGEYERHLVCMESYLGKDAESQAIRIKELFEDFQADYIIIDTQGIGYTVADYLYKKSFDKDRGKEYPGYVSFNDDAKIDYEIKRSGVPVVYAMNASANLNMQMNNSLRDAFYTQKIKLPITELDAKSLIFQTENIKSNDLKRKISIESELLLPFIQTDLLVNEMIGLETIWNEDTFKLKEKGSAKKDRFSALLYGNFLCDYLEKENYKKLNKKKGGYMFLH